ncbi:MAG TPA: DivIVA domain-containing protein [Microbacteriaceae bacterium]|nr:DivIVA domain-containing protein [Microbacteriaceae bacterium]
MTTFRTVHGRRRGYDPDEVDGFLARARAAYNDESGVSLAAREVRGTAFTLRRGGYETAEVDAALERLESALAARERESERLSLGDSAFREHIRLLWNDIAARLDRGDGRRFSRVSALSHGYRIREVDRLARQVSDYLTRSAPLGVETVRSSAFGAERRGYREAEVDALLDAVVEAMLASG